MALLLCLAVVLVSEVPAHVNAMPVVGAPRASAAADHDAADRGTGDTPGMRGSPEVTPTPPPTPPPTTTTTLGGRIRGFRYGVSTVSRGAFTTTTGSATADTVELEWVFWLWEKADRRVLIDTGFDDPTLVRRWGLREFVPPAQLVPSPETITDIILTHEHFDHAGARARFPHARVHAQRAAGVAGAVQLDGDHTLWPGVRVVYAGGHTGGSQAVLIDADDGLHVFVGDECYRSEWCDAPLPSSALADARRHDTFRARLARWRAAGAFVHTGHQLAVGR
jgi:glyoxylase-like metal-dependent hydrolase (beta-lactamase superfamily II)